MKINKNKNTFGDSDAAIRCRFVSVGCLLSVPLDVRTRPTRLVFPMPIVSHWIRAPWRVDVSPRRRSYEILTLTTQRAFVSQLTRMYALGRLLNVREVNFFIPAARGICTLLSCRRGCRSSRDKACLSRIDEILRRPSWIRTGVK